VCWYAVVLLRAAAPERIDADYSPPAGTSPCAGAGTINSGTVNSTKGSAAAGFGFLAYERSARGICLIFVVARTMRAGGERRVAPAAAEAPVRFLATFFAARLAATAFTGVPFFRAFDVVAGFFVRAVEAAIRDVGRRFALVPRAGVARFAAPRATDFCRPFAVVAIAASQ